MPSVAYSGSTYGTHWDYSGAGHPRALLPSSGVAAGDVAYVALGKQTSETITTPAGWTRVAGNGSTHVNVYRKVLVSGDLGSAVTFTITNAYFSTVVNLVICTGVDGTTPENVVGTLNNVGWSNSPVTASGPTTTVANTLGLAFFGSGDDGGTMAVTVGSPWTELLDEPGAQSACATATLAISSTGAASSCTFTPNGYGFLGAVIIAVAPSGGGATTHTATAAGTSSSTGAAAAIAVRGASASGTGTATGSAAGARLMAATASGTATATGAAAGYRATPATASGTTTATGAAAASIVAVHVATASGTTTATGSAAAIAVRGATASGTTTATGAAAVTAVAAPTASGTATATGSAAATIVTSTSTVPTVRVVGTGVTYSGAGQPSIIIPATAQAGDVCFMAIGFQTSVSASDPAGWTTVATIDDRLVVYRKTLTSGDPGSSVPFTVSPAWYPAGVAVVVLANAGATDAVGTVVNPGWVDTATAIGPTTTAADEIAVAFAALTDSPDATFTVSSPWTEQTDAANGYVAMASATLARPTAGAVPNATFTTTIAGTMRAVIVTVKAAAPAGPQTLTAQTTGTSATSGAAAATRIGDPQVMAVSASGTAQTTGRAAVVPKAGGRNPKLWPFDTYSPWNLPVGSGAILEPVGSTKTQNLRTAPTPTWLNCESYSIVISFATESDPLAYIEDLEHPWKSGYARIPAGTEGAIGTDGAGTVIQPDGETVEMFVLRRITDTHYTVMRVERNSIYAMGLGPEGGIRAYGGSTLGGIIRRWEVDPSHPDYTDGVIRHALAVSVPNSILLYTSGSAGYDANGYGTAYGYQWPATEQDWDSQYAYYGPTPMGTYFCIPKSVNINTLGLTASGLKMARALQDYGGYVVDRGGSFSFYAEPNVAGTAFYNEVLSVPNWTAEDLQRLRAQIVVVTNSTPSTPNGGGTYSPLAPSLSTGVTTHVGFGVGQAASSGSATATRRIVVSASATAVSTGSARPVGVLPASASGTAAATGSASATTTTGSVTLGAGAIGTSSTSASADATLLVAVLDHVAASGVSLSTGSAAGTLVSGGNPGILVVTDAEPAIVVSDASDAITVSRVQGRPHMQPIPSSSSEYIYNTATTVEDPSELTVMFAFLDTENHGPTHDPDDDEYVAGEWFGATETLPDQRFRKRARVKVGAGSSLTEPGVYHAWMKVGTQVRRFDRIRLS